MTNTEISNVASTGLILFLFFTFISCSKQAEIPFDDLPVVEAYLIPGTRISITISRKIPVDESATLTELDVDNLDVTVVYQNVPFHLIPLGKGQYADTNRIIPVVPEGIYILQFSWQGASVTSSTLIPSKPSGVMQSSTSISMYQFDPENPAGGTHPDPVTISYTNSDNSYYLVTVTCLETNPVPVFKDSIPENDLFSTHPTTASYVNIEPMMIRYFGKNMIILYHINPEYSVFFMRQMSTSQNYQEPPSNIENGLGIFTGVNADTLYLDVIQKTD